MEANILKNLDDLNRALSQPQKKKMKRRYEGKVDLKNLLKSKTLKKISKERLEIMLEAAYPQLQRELKKYFEGNSKIIDDKQTLTEIFTNKKFAKSLCKIIDENEINDNLVFYAISELWISGSKAFSKDEKLAERYLKSFSKREKKKIKKVAEILDIKKSQALQIVLSTLHYKGAKIKTMKDRYKTFFTLIYSTAAGNTNGEEKHNFTSKQLSKVINILFKDCKLQFYSFALGERERKNDKAFDAMTKSILNGIDNLPKDTRKELLKNYAKRRKKNNSMNRRVSLLAVANDYPNMNKTIKKLIDTGMNKELFQ